MSELTSARSPQPTSVRSAEPEPRLVGHSPAGRLVAQRGLFRGPNPICPDDLYAQVTSGTAVRDRDRLVVHAGSAVTTDTYFGRFPAAYWQRWTVVDQVEVELVVTGSGRLSVVASDMRGETRVVAARVIHHAERETVRITAALDRFLDGGFLWLDAETEDGELVVEQMRWTVEPPEQLRPTAVVICTFNRADDCIATITALSSDEQVLGVLDAVYVVDQGTDTVESRATFSDVEKALDGRLRYIRQPNLGGAGGFGRGMYEVTEVSHADHANVLLMDDDVLCDPEIAIRLTSFANRTAEPTIVGGQMLRLLHPTHLFAGAEYADFSQLRPGRVVDNALDDVDLLAEEVDEDGMATGKVNRGDRRVDADYNAWWSCLIPSEIVTQLGYPLPLFFQWDDVEYGYRARAKGFATVTLPGAGLWHADFDWKDADKWNEYFALRNAMIVTALHSEVAPGQLARVLVARVMRYLLSMQYGLAATLLQATEDFLRGPEFLHDGGVAAATAIRTLRARFPDTVMHAPNELPGVGSASTVPMVAAGPTPSRPRLVLIKRLVNLALGRTAHQIGTISAMDSAWWHVSQFETAVVTDASQAGVRLLRRDRDQTIRMGMWLGRTVRRLLAEFPAVREQYRAAMPELTSRENWRRLYGL
jgi:galactofuranosylgalactofuranosylrhamnosyl-N-acetylglucosaminyl-diphospho-decaprenol beta-1,5/1,6-galactofuranosyltransferase